VWLGSTRSCREMVRALIAQQVNIRLRSVPHRMCAKAAPTFLTHLRQATRYSFAFATLATQALTETPAPCVWLGSTRSCREMVRALIA